MTYKEARAEFLKAQKLYANHPSPQNEDALARAYKVMESAKEAEKKARG